jgi:hypothetical protein
VGVFVEFIIGSVTLIVITVLIIPFMKVNTHKISVITRGYFLPYSGLDFKMRAPGRIDENTKRE